MLLIDHPWHIHVPLVLLSRILACSLSPSCIMLGHVVGVWCPPAIPLLFQALPDVCLRGFPRATRLPVSRDSPVSPPISQSDVVPAGFAGGRLVPVWTMPASSHPFCVASWLPHDKRSEERVSSSWMALQQHGLAAGAFFLKRSCPS